MVLYRKLNTRERPGGSKESAYYHHHPSFTITPLSPSPHLSPSPLFHHLSNTASSSDKKSTTHTICILKNTYLVHPSSIVPHLSPSRLFHHHLFHHHHHPSFTITPLSPSPLSPSPLFHQDPSFTITSLSPQRKQQQTTKTTTSQELV